MKISLSRDIKGNTGFQNFLRRLMREFVNNYDVKMVGAKDKSDIHLAPISGLKAGARNILRIDGVYYDKPRMSMNASIKRCLLRADGVVFQSHWSKIFAIKMLKAKPKKSVVIYNGVDPATYKKAPIERYGFDHLFMASAHWRASKRPTAIVEAFLDIVERPEVNAGLLFAGRFKNIIKHPCIKYFPKPNENLLLSLYKSADYLVHICHLDSCPNSVVEALNANCAVVCNNIGGTPEIVGSDGVIAKIDKPFNFKPINNIEDIGNRSVNHDVLVGSMLQVMNRDWSISRPDLHISTVAKQYYDFFVQILSGK